MRLVLLAVGAPKSPALAAAIDDYEMRIARYFKFESLEVRPVRAVRGSTDSSIVVRESQELLERAPDGFEVIAVDQRGVAWSSEHLAGYLADLALHSKPGVAFLIGGPLGLSESLRRSANHLLALSAFTLPHELARLVLTEQIYRAGTIQRGEPYHKSG